MYFTMSITKIYRRTMVIVAAICIALAFMSFNTTFCDFYTDNIYPYIADTLGWITSGVEVAVGEIVMYLAIISLIVLLVMVVLIIFLRKKERYMRIVKVYLCVLLGWGMLTMLSYVLNWVIPLRCSGIQAGTEGRSNFTIEEIQSLRNYIVEQWNECAANIERDDKGRIVYGTDIEGRVIHAMQRCGETYPRLKGYYPGIKEAMCSDFLEWMGIAGYTYPFTMEMTNNKYNYAIYEPVLYAHEAAHHKGFYRESEANFISMISCMNSGDEILKYSAYREMYYYVNGEYCRNLMKHMDKKEAAQMYLEQPQLTDIIFSDESDEEEKAEEQYDSEVNKKLEEAVSGYAEKAAETGWETQEKVLDEDNYDGVVLLLLRYYCADR